MRPGRGTVRMPGGGVQPRLGHRPALDGLRGVAVLLVVAAHAVNGVSPYKVGFDLPVFAGGGIVGVQLFFALSGWLITTRLLEERENRARVDMGQFYMRRVRRLQPALIAIVLVDIVVGTVQQRPVVESSIVALGYVANLGVVGGWSAHWLGHAWSLAVEEQFYASWPWVTRLRANWRAIGWFALGIAAVTLSLRLVVPYSKAYYLLRWDAIALGCAAAAFRWRPSPALFAVGWVVVLVTAQRLVPSNTMLTVTAITSAVVVAGSRDASWLASSWLVWAGKRSYALYLWHVWWLRFGWAPWVALALSAVTAELSWHLVERPWMRRGPAPVEGTPQVPDPPVPAHEVGVATSWQKA